LIFTSDHTKMEAWFEPAKILVQQGYTVAIFEVRTHPENSRHKLKTLATAINSLRLAPPQTPQILLSERPSTKTVIGLTKHDLHCDALVEIDDLPAGLNQRTFRWYGGWPAAPDGLRFHRPSTGVDLTLGTPQTAADLARSINRIVQAHRDEFMVHGS